jgi:acetyl esterase
MLADNLLRVGGRPLLRLHRAWRRARPLPPVINDRGERLDGEIQALLALDSWLPMPTLAELSVEAARRDTRLKSRLVGLAPEPLSVVQDRLVGGASRPLRFRIYRPDHRRLPALVYLHGGGFVIGDLDSHDSVCRYLSAHGECVVISVDYRRAPEHPFPAAVEDAISAYQWVVEHTAELGLRPDRIAVGGDSAGGNLAANVALHARDEHAALPCLQLLVYPSTDMRRQHASHRTLAEGFFLDERTMDWFQERYLKSAEDVLDPRASPLLAPDHSHLPPALLLTAGFDPLRDEGEDYGQRLERAGVRVEHRSYGSLIHGFVNMGGAARAARRAIHETAVALRRWLHA